MESLEARMAELKQGGAGGVGGFLKGTGGIALGGTVAAAGISGAVALGSMAIKSAYATDLMERSTEQVFGAAAESYKVEAEKMADATGFLTTEILAAQIAMSKSSSMAGLDQRYVQPLVARAADIADATGLPGYANDLQAVTNAVSAGLRGSAGALLDFGIRLDDLYVLSLPANLSFKRLGDAITPAQMAAARYNAIMAQSAKIAGDAAENSDDMNESMRQLGQKMESAKEAVGEALIPVANTLANFIDKIPKELLEAGVWAGLGISMATALGGAVIGIRALATSVTALGRAATTSAAETAAAATTVGTASKGAIGGKSTGLGGVAGALGAVAIAAPILIDSLAELIRGITNDENNHENKYTKALGTITGEDGGPGKWDRLMAAVADNPVLAKMPANIFMAAGLARLINGPTETEALAKERATSTPAWNEMKFEEWMASQSRTTGQWLPGDTWQASGGGPLSVNLGSGNQMMTYDQMQQAFMKNFATVDPLSGKVQTTITIVDRTQRGRASLHA